MVITSSVIVIREIKPSKIEVVCRKTGKARIIAKLDEPTSLLDMPIAEGFLPFGNRPVESFEKLRELRTTVILDYRRAKIKDRKVKTSRTKTSKPKTTGKMSKLNTRVEDQLKEMDPRIAEAISKGTEDV